MKHIVLSTALMLAAMVSGNAWAQTDEPAGIAQEQVAPDQEMQNGMMNEQAAGEAMDPASPEADAIRDPMEGSPETDMGEAGEPEETGPADMISDSSERALSRADVDMLDCEELWIARNEIFDRNGYCFRSARGQDYFDNSDCTSDSQDILSSLEWENVRLVQSIEREKQCN